MREVGSGTRAVAEECFVALGIDPPQLSIASNGAISACMRAGLGFSLVSRDGVEHELRTSGVQQIVTAFTPLTGNGISSQRAIVTFIQPLNTSSRLRSSIAGSSFQCNLHNPALISGHSLNALTISSSVACHKPRRSRSQLRITDSSKGYASSARIPIAAKSSGTRSALLFSRRRARFRYFRVVRRSAWPTSSAMCSSSAPPARASVMLVARRP